MAKDLLHTWLYYKDPLFKELVAFEGAVNDLWWCISIVGNACTTKIDEQLTSSEVKRCILDMAKAMKTVCEHYNNLDTEEMIERIPVEKGS